MSTDNNFAFVFGPHRVDSTAFVAPGHVASDGSVYLPLGAEESIPEFTKSNQLEIRELKIQINYTDNFEELTQHGLDALVRASARMIDDLNKGEVPEFV